MELSIFIYIFALVMATIGKNYKEAINRNFMHVAMKRDAESVFEALNIGLKGSDNMIMLPKVEKVELTKVDDLHDKLSLSWDDYKTEGVVTWRPSESKVVEAMVFCGIE